MMSYDNMWECEAERKVSNLKTREDKSENEKETDITHKRTHRIVTELQTFCPAVKCPNSLFAASAPLLWATYKINGDHYRRHATQALLV